MTAVLILFLVLSLMANAILFFRGRKYKKSLADVEAELAKVKTGSNSRENATPDDEAIEMTSSQEEEKKSKKNNTQMDS